MPNIIVNESLCTGCGVCATKCPMGIIEIGERAFIAEEKQPYCFRCGHCEAFCPSHALILDYRPDEKTEPGDGYLLDAETLSHYVEMRRSIRDFSPEPVDQALIERILSVAQYAPSAGNTQTVQWLVVYDTAKVQRVSELVVEWMRSMLGSPHPFAPYFSRIVTAWDAGTDVVCQGAPHLLFAHLPVNGGDPSTDAIIALTHFDLLAPAFGLGACWAGFIKMALMNYPPLVEFLGLPADRVPVYALFFGYPTVKPVTIPRRNPVRIGWV